MMNTLERSGLDADHIIPKVSERVKESVEEKTLHLSFDNRTKICTKIEGIVWALCRPGISTLSQIEKQFNSIEIEEHQNPPKDIVERTVANFHQQKMLQLSPLEPSYYPCDISAYTHIFSSRGGLYAVNSSEFKRIAYGMYFGLCSDAAGGILVFEFTHLTSSLWATNFSSAKKLMTNEGSIKLFDTNAGLVAKPKTLHSDITNNCHHLVFDNGTLYGVDTERQGIFSIDKDGGRAFHDFYQDEPYHHINSMVKDGESWLVMKSMKSYVDSSSSFWVFNSDWKLIDDIALPAHRAHDLLLTQADQTQLDFWYCDSSKDHIRHFPSENFIHVASPGEHNNTTRGLSHGQGQLVIGNGEYGAYYGHNIRGSMLGAINFVDSITGVLKAQVKVPEAPCCIIPNPAYAA